LPEGVISSLHLIKGYNLKLSGRPLPEVEDVSPPNQVAAAAGRLRFVKPRLAVKVGDRVKVGSLLFSDKNRPEIQFRSPGGGTVNAVIFGPRRRLQEVAISLDIEEGYEEFPQVADAELGSIGRERLIELIVGGGLWPLIRELPFRDAALPEALPPAVFVYLDNLEPFHPLPKIYLDGAVDLLDFGLRVIERLAGAPAVVTACRDNAEALGGLKRILGRTLEGNYPAHDPGVVLYRTKTSADQNHAWFIEGQDLLLIAELLKSGRFPTGRVVTLGGPAATRPGHFHTRIGAPLAALIDGRTAAGEVRLVAGGVLTGNPAPRDSHLGLFEKALMLLPEGNASGDFLGWTMPGAQTPSYSRAFLSSFRRGRDFPMDCNRRGGLRACIQCNFCTQVCPVDILPQLTYKAILAGEVEESLAHGLLDCVECGLCSLVCPSKIELLKTLRQAREQFYEEMS
jgi:Na+-transporting NADH:ubiquinone oxidoreductase subunit A